MHSGAVRFLLMAVIAVPVASCKFLGMQKDILDAAELYQKNKAAYDSIRQRFPGPYVGTKHIEESKADQNTAEDMTFLKSLQSRVPVESITLYRLDSRDIIIVSIANYGLSVSGISVSLIYYEKGGPWCRINDHWYAHEIWS